jgi:hypothetical protein
MNTRTTPVPAQHSYPAWLVWRIAPLLVALGIITFLWIIVFLIPLKMVFTTSSAMRALHPMIAVISAVMLVLGAFLCLFTMGTRIITTSEGIFCYRAGSCLYSPWNNLEGLEKISMGAFAIENLRLKRPAIEGLSIEEGIKEEVAVLIRATASRITQEALPWLRASPLLLSIISALNGSSYTRYMGPSSSNIDPRYIPVGLCGNAWKNGELFQDVRNYAPQAI